MEFGFPDLAQIQGLRISVMDDTQPFLLPNSFVFLFLFFLSLFGMQHLLHSNPKQKKTRVYRLTPTRCGFTGLK